MQKLKFLSTLIVVIAVLVIVMISLPNLVSQFDLSTKDSRPAQKTENEVQGVSFREINYSVDNSLYIFINGLDSQKIVSYKLSTGRQKLVHDFGDSMKYFVPGNIQIIDTNLYWVENNVVFKKDINSQEVQEIYKFEDNRNLVGLNIFEDKVYITAYLFKDGLYDQTIYGIFDGKLTEMFKSQETNIYTYNKIENDKLIVSVYQTRYNNFSNNCFSLPEKVEKVCENLPFKLLNPTQEGYRMGSAGFIEYAPENGGLETLVFGVEDEVFESPRLYQNKVYFISGVLEAASAYLQEDVFGSFVPLYLEVYDFKTETRSKLKDLPPSQSAQIKYIDDSIIVLSISERSTNKFETKPKNLWIYNFQTKTLEKLTNIDCPGSFCEVEIIL